MNIEIRKVPFMDTELMAARDNEGNIYAGVRWMCEGIGLASIFSLLIRDRPARV